MLTPLSQFFTKLVDIAVHDKHVSLAFDDGESVSGDIVIGCDGSHSRVREFLVGREVAQLGATWTTMVNYGGGSYTVEQPKLLRSYHPIVQPCPHHEISSVTLLAGRR